MAIGKEDILNAIAKRFREMAKACDDWTTWASKPKRFTPEEGNAFFIGVFFDQQQPADWAWEGGEHMAANHFQGENFWESVSCAPLSKVKRIMRYGWDGNAYFRFWNRFSKHLKDNAKVILDSYEGDVRNVWKGLQPRDVNEIYCRFLEFKGIGPALAKMAQFILVRDHGMAGGELSKHHMRVKPDRHVCRVTYRLGLVSNTRPKIVAAEIDQLWQDGSFDHAGIESQADFDLVVFRVGQYWCKQSSPNCVECPLRSVCEQRGI